MDMTTLCPRCQIVSFNDAHAAVGNERLADEYRMALATPFDAPGSDTDFPNEPSQNSTRKIGLDFELSDHYPELPRLTQSGAAGCDFCTFLLRIIKLHCTREEIKRIYGQDISSQMKIRLEYLRTEKRPSAQLGLSLMRINVAFDAGPFGKNLSLWCSVKALPYSPEVGQLLELDLSLEQDYLCQRSVHWMKSQVDECEEHDHVSEAPYIPTRLIDVRESRARLVLGSEIPVADYSMTMPRYAALSYCWGIKADAAQQLTTKVDSLPSRLAGIYDHEMTEVLRDAIRITQALGIPYLWVDALCIIQDDQLDWERECVAMGQIYGNAHVTLCALASGSCNEGFLKPATERAVVKVPFHSTLHPAVKGAYQLRYLFPQHNMFSSDRDYPPNQFGYDIICSRWNHRAWVYQETALLKRMLLFGATDVHFHCPDQQDSPRWPVVPVKPSATLGNSKLWTFRERGMDGVEEGYCLWVDVVEEFSRDAQLTLPADVLPCLSGLASIVHSHLQDRYLAGMWERGLPRTLLWKWDGLREKNVEQIGFGDFIRRLANQHPYIDPSWSWIGHGRVSLWHHGIRFEAPDFKTLYDSLDAIVQLEEDGNPFGRITSGVLRITSKMRLAYVPAEGNWTFGSHFPMRAVCHFDLSIGSQIPSAFAQDLHFVLLGTRSRTRRPPFDSISNNKAGYLSFGDVYYDSYGLIVYPAGVDGKHFRVGDFALPSITDLDACLKDWDTRSIEII